MAYFQDPIVKAIQGLGNYAYLPPRLSYYPPDPPYLGGLRGLRGLGDYAADMAAYERDHNEWLQEKASYERSMSYYVGSIKAQQDAYARAQQAYVADKAAWDREVAAYNSAMLTYNARVSATRAANVAAANEVARAHNITLQQWVYDQGGCVTVAQQANYKSHCQSVRGLGAGELFVASVNCAYAKLPVCGTAPARPTLRPQPTPPRAPTSTAQAPTLRPEPQPPVRPPPVTCWNGSQAASAAQCPPRPATTPVPVSTTPPKTWPTAAPTPSDTPLAPASPTPPTPLTPLTPEEDLKNKNILMGGLLAVVLVGGGYLAYRTFKKPKAA